MATITETILADIQVKGLDKFGQLKVSMDTVAKSSEKAAKGIETIKVQASRAGKALGVNTKIARRFVNTALNAGFAAEDQAKAMEKIKEVAEKTGKPVEVIEKAWEGLARTLQNAEDATDNLEDALRFQARSGIPEAEKAAASYAQTIGGGTQALKQLTGVGELYAKQLDQIRDADLKAKLTTELARKELNRKRAAIERVKDAYLVMGLRMKAALGPTGMALIRVATKVVKALAVAFAVTLVAAVTVAAKAIKKFLETNEDTKKATDRLKKSVDALQVALGSALVGGAKKATTGLNDLTAKVNVLTETIKKNQLEINTMFTETLGLVVFAFEVTIGFLGAFALSIGMVFDQIELIISGLGLAVIGLGTVFALAFESITRSIKDAVGAFIGLLDLMGQGDRVSPALRQWVTEVKEVKDILANASDMAEPFFDRMSEGFKRTMAVDDYTKRLHKLIAVLKSAKAPGGAAFDPLEPYRNNPDWEIVDGKPVPVVPFGPPEPSKTTGGAGGGGGGAATRETPARFGSGVDNEGNLLQGFAAQGGRIGKPGAQGDMGAPDRSQAEGFKEFFGTLREEAETTLDVYNKFFDDMDQGMIDMGISMTQNFGGSAAKAFGAAAASSASFGAAMKELLKNTLAGAAESFGKFFVLKGVAISLDPLLGGPAVGGPMIAAGLALQAFGGAIGAAGSSGGKGASAAPAAADLAAFQPREQAKEEPRETTLVINIAGETVGPAIWRAMDEGVRLGHVAQFA